jgi:OOP family OmpA-OmpF porin
MSKKVIFPLLAVFTIGIVGGSLGCQASANAKVGDTEAKAATPPPAPPPPPEPPPAPPPEPPKAIKPLGKAKIENNEIKIPGKVHFETNSAKIKEDAETKEILKTIADVMKENTQITKLRIEGHTDNVGGDEPNIKLSQGRADSVIEWLTKNGVDKARLEGKGWGEHHPIAANDTAANKEQNRRVEFKLWEVDGKATDAQKKDMETGTPTSVGAGTTTKKDDKKAVTAPAGTGAPTPKK